MGPRLVCTETREVYANLALEEALLREHSGLTLRLWENERSIIIGRGQLADYETDLETCRRGNLPVVRRITAGGAVYNGPGNANWSLFVPVGYRSKKVGYQTGPREIFEMAGSLVVEALKMAGVDAWLDRPNRILTREGKVSGMAAYVSKDCLLCHGTLLLAADLDEAARLTTPRDAPLEKRYVRSRAMVMANTGISSDGFLSSMKASVGEATGLELECSAPSPEERELSAVLTSKYQDPRWSLGDPFEVMAG